MLPFWLGIRSGMLAKGSGMTGVLVQHDPSALWVCVSYSQRFIFSRTTLELFTARLAHRSDTACPSEGGEGGSATAAGNSPAATEVGICKAALIRAFQALTITGSGISDSAIGSTLGTGVSERQTAVFVFSMLI